MANSYPGKRTLADKYYFIEMDDVSAASSAWCPIVAQGELIGLRSILHGAITGANATITVEINGNAVSGATLTIAQSGSAAGDIDSVDFPAYPVKDGDKLEIITDGASSTTARATFVAIVREL